MRAPSVHVAEEVKKVQAPVIKETPKPAPVAPKVAVPVKAGPHLKKPEDITGFVEFPAGTNSSLCKFMTKAVFDKYHLKKDSAGVSFEQMILSGS